MKADSLKQSFHLRQDGDDAQVIAALLSLISQRDRTKEYEITFKRYRHDRSAEQNAQGHVWYNLVSKETGEDTPAGIKRFCKLNFGVPILRAEVPEFRALYDRAIKGSLSYEEKIQAMDYLQVTSLMNTEQKSRYLEAVQAHYAQAGITLYFGEELRRDAELQGRG